MHCRVYDTMTGELLQEVRRGSEKAEVYSIAFNANSSMLACTSDKGTVHIFRLRDNVHEGAIGGPAAPLGMGLAAPAGSGTPGAGVSAGVASSSGSAMTPSYGYSSGSGGAGAGQRDGGVSGSAANPHSHSGAGPGGGGPAGGSGGGMGGGMGMGMGPSGGDADGVVATDSNAKSSFVRCPRVTYSGAWHANPCFCLCAMRLQRFATSTLCASLR